MKNFALKLSGIVLVLLGFFACETTAPELEITPGNEIFGLASPIRLNRGETEVVLQDYFLQPEKIDSVSAETNLLVSLSEDKSLLRCLEPGGEAIPVLNPIQVWIGGKSYSLIAFRSTKQNVTLTFDPKGETYAKVAVAGSLNDWNPDNSPMTWNESSGKWSVTLPLAAGTYQYQIVVDGEWMLDPGNPVKVDNNIGGFNSELVVEAANRADLPHMETASAGTCKVNLRLTENTGTPIAFWENYQIPVKEDANSPGNFEIQLPRACKGMMRSYLRVWVANENGAGNDLFVPIETGVPITDPNRLVRKDRRAMIMYFMLVDRFNNGNQENDAPLDDPRVLDKANYFGGDLAGITQKVEDGFFADLGINTLWISPIPQNPEGAYQEWPEPRRYYSGYHGYWPVQTTKVDHRFGSGEELKALIEAAHSHDNNVLLDFVANHVHQENKWIQEHPEFKTQLELEGGKLNIRIWDEQRLTTWFDTFLPSLDFSQPEVIETQVDTCMYWAQEYGFDGFRHDATKHIPEAFWRRLTEKLKKEYMIPENQQLYQIGETFGSRELIGNYVGSGMLDAQFDFNLYFDARTVFADSSTSFEKLDNSLQETFDWYGHHHMMGNITGNHDIARFISYAGGAMRFDEDDKAAGWNRDIQVENPVGYKRLSMLTAFIMTVPGVPIIYYGDEYGMPGAGDPDNRRMMKFEGLSDEEKATKNRCKSLIQLRKDHLALIYGSFRTLHLDPMTWAYSRAWFEDYVVVAFNKSNQEKTVKFEIPEAYRGTEFMPQFSRQVNRDGNSIELILPPNSFEVVCGE